ncbi:WD40/YVTN/BNR-like repeat-containing protein [Thalassotalea ganghwensis]
MIRILSLIFAVIFASLSVCEINNHPAIMSKLAQKSLMLDIENVGDQFLIAVGERGHILRSDNGKDWQQMTSPTQTALTSVNFVSYSEGWAVGHDATILYTNDSGFTWQVQYINPKLETPFLNVMFKDNQNGVAVGSYGMFIRTQDGGKSWNREYHTSLLSQEDKDYLEELKRDDEAAYLDERARILPHFNKVYQDGRTTYLAGELGLLAKSNDFGRTWQKFDAFYHGSLYDIQRSPKGNLLAVGLRGNVFRSTNNGDEWQQIEVSTTALLNDVVVYDEQTTLILGNNGVLLKSDDDGNRFVIDEQADGKALIAGTFFKNQLVVASEVGIKIIQVRP